MCEQQIKDEEEFEDMFFDMEEKELINDKESDQRTMIQMLSDLRKRKVAKIIRRNEKWKIKQQMEIDSWTKKDLEVIKWKKVADNQEENQWILRDLN